MLTSAPLRRSSALLLAAALLVAAGCTPAAERAEPDTRVFDASAPSRPEPERAHYRATVWFWDYWAGTHLLVNGFPVWSTGWGYMSRNPRLSIPVEAALMRGENRFTVRAEPKLELSGNGVYYGPVEMWAHVGQAELSGEVGLDTLTLPPRQVERAYASWQQRADSAQAALVAEGAAGQELLRAMRRWAERNPFVVEARFTAREGPDFSALFGQSAPVIAGTPADSARLRGYALRLRDLVASQNVEALLGEIAPAVSDSLGASALTLEADPSLAQKLAALRTYWSYETDWGAEHVRLRSWSGGRLWELYLDGAQGEGRVSPLFYRAGNEMRVYAGEREGKLRVVRLGPP